MWVWMCEYVGAKHVKVLYIYVYINVYAWRQENTEDNDNIKLAGTVTQYFHRQDEDVSTPRHKSSIQTLTL